jgi:hypothetical protein
LCKQAKKKQKRFNTLNKVAKHNKINVNVAFKCPITQKAGIWYLHWLSPRTPVRFPPQAVSLSENQPDLYACHLVDTQNVDRVTHWSACTLSVMRNAEQKEMTIPMSGTDLYSKILFP